MFFAVLFRAAPPLPRTFVFYTVFLCFFFDGKKHTVFAVLFFISKFDCVSHVGLAHNHIHIHIHIRYPYPLAFGLWSLSGPGTRNPPPAPEPPHLGECQGITNVLCALNKVARFSPKAEKSREGYIVDNLFIYPKGDAPKAIYTLYLLAWRYIITDFYRIHYDGIKFSEESILIRTIERYTTLSKAFVFANGTDSTRTAQAGMGRQPKKKIRHLRPVFTLNDKGVLKPSEELVELATKLGIAHAVEGSKEQRNNGEKARGTENLGSTRDPN